MTESTTPAPPASWQYETAADPANTSLDLDAPADSGSADDGKVGAAKEQAAAVGQGAAQAGQQVASVAKDQAQNVVAEAGTQAKDLVGQARSELTSQAAAQQARLASGLHALGDELDSMTQHSEQPGVATDLAKQAAGRAHDVGSWLDAREPGHLLQEMQSFARQRPAAFLALAAGAGLVAGRLGRGVKDAGGDDAPGADSSAPITGLAPITEPVPTEPVPTEPVPTEPVPTEPATTEPAPSYPVDEVRPFASSQDFSRDEFRGVGGTQ